MDNQSVLNFKVTERSWAMRSLNGTVKNCLLSGLTDWHDRNYHEIKEKWCIANHATVHNKKLTVCKITHHKGLLYIKWRIVVAPVKWFVSVTAAVKCFLRDQQLYIHHLSHHATFHCIIQPSECINIHICRSRMALELFSRSSNLNWPRRLHRTKEDKVWTIHESILR